jgi:transcription-repair coupling factor (superfamily II helicase)
VSSEAEHSQIGPEPSAQLELERAHSLGAFRKRVHARSAPLRIVGLRGSARAAVVAELVRDHGERSLLWIAPSSKVADLLAADLRAALGSAESAARVRLFPRHDTHPYERFSPQPFVTAQRMDVLYRWLCAAGTKAERREPAPIAIAPWTALAARVPSREAVRAHTLHLVLGQRLDRDALVKQLLSSGYGRSPLVQERGELSVRGGILDLFPPQRERPLRVEFLDDEIESIREFDPASQRSERPLDSAVAPPPHELLFDRALVVERNAALRELAREQGVSDAAIDEFVDALLRGFVPPGAEALAPLLQPALETVLDFLPADTLVLIDEPTAGRERLQSYVGDAAEHYSSARASGRPACRPEELFLADDELEEKLLARNALLFERQSVLDAVEPIPSLELRTQGHEELRAALARSRRSEHALAPLVEALVAWRDKDRRIVATAGAMSSAERLRTLLNDYGVKAAIRESEEPIWKWSEAGRIEIRIASLSEGFELPAAELVLLTEEEIFGPRERRKNTSKWPAGAAIEVIERLAVGDYLVHADHGIGIYRGLVPLELRGASGEFLRIEYDGGDRLFLPVDRLNRVAVYAGSDGLTPRVDKLGGSTWDDARKKVKRTLRDMTRELLSVHAARELAPGFAFSPRDHGFEEFEAAFPFEETPDQLAVIEEVLGDMQQSRPMDRLVCGDVGYGKTEVAVRAAFRAAMDGRQVAVLVPTTILCQQHEETFRRRFEGYPIELAKLSRFESPKQSKRVMEGLATGRIDVVIGTHRLLQKNIAFRDLGLLIIDEEHRFGVAHKERIKQLKKNIDVLTLTATPIPRTLQLAFAGLRNLSVIETPPADRMAIRTQVCRFSAELVREVILREVKRGGQVYYVHNQVQTIDAVAELLARAVPEVRVIVAHGQMPERDLEDRVLRFMHGEADVLLCTTIIESGIDIPRANTILIDRADRLGLAQVYQLRGRVGRSNQRAYAYLMIPSSEGLTPRAEKRLEAIQELSDLGSGFRLANLDLEIRGAGNLLGAEQSGALAAVGFETYMQMLEETIEEMRGQVRAVEVDPEIRLPIKALFPENYVAQVSQRLVLYKRLASCRDDLEIDRIRDEILDRFGTLPQEAENLLIVIRLKVAARRLGIAAVDYSSGELVLSAGSGAQIDPKKVVALMRNPRNAGGVRVSPGHKIYAPATDASAQGLYQSALQLFDRLALQSR